jgi:hypothetical protein
VTLAACLSAIAGVSLETPGEGAGFSAEDAAAAKSILSRAATPDEVAYRVLSILSNPEGPERKDDWANFKCVRDAIRIAEAVEAVKSGKTEGTAGSTGTQELYTETGRKLMETVSSEQ